MTKPGTKVVLTRQVESVLVPPLSSVALYQPYPPNLLATRTETTAPAVAKLQVSKTMVTGVFFWIAMSAELTSGAIGSAGELMPSTLTIFTVGEVADWKMVGVVPGATAMVEGVVITLELRELASIRSRPSYPLFRVPVPVT